MVPLNEFVRRLCLSVAMIQVCCVYKEHCHKTESDLFPIVSVWSVLKIIYWLALLEFWHIPKIRHSSFAGFRSLLISTTFLVTALHSGFAAGISVNSIDRNKNIYINVWSKMFVLWLFNVLHELSFGWLDDNQWDPSLGTSKPNLKRVVLNSNWNCKCGFITPSLLASACLGTFG